MKSNEQDRKAKPQQEQMEDKNALTTSIGQNIWDVQLWKEDSHEHIMILILFLKILHSIHEPKSSKIFKNKN